MRATLAALALAAALPAQASRHGCYGDIPERVVWMEVRGEARPGRCVIFHVHAQSPTTFVAFGTAGSIDMGRLLPGFATGRLCLIPLVIEPCTQYSDIPLWIPRDPSFVGVVCLAQGLELWLGQDPTLAQAMDRWTGAVSESFIIRIAP